MEVLVMTEKEISYQLRKPQIKQLKQVKRAKLTKLTQ